MKRQSQADWTENFKKDPIPLLTRQVESKRIRKVIPCKYEIRI